MLVDTLEDEQGLRVLKVKQALVIIEAKVSLTGPRINRVKEYKLTRR